MAFRYNTPRKPEPAAPAPSPFADPSVPSEWGAPAAQEVDDAAQGGFFGGAEPAASPFEGAVAPGVAPVTRNVLNSDVSIVGILRFTDDLLVDGSVEGEITSDGVLTVGANATIQASDKNKVAVRTKSAIIQGRVTGDVVVTDRVELTATAELIGDVTANKISIQEGAVFIGNCLVAAATSMPASAAKKPAKPGKASDNLLG